MYKIILLLPIFVFTNQALAKKTSLRKYVGATYVINDEKEYDDAYGAFATAEIDFKDGYISAGQSLSYYEAQAKDDGAKIDPVSPAYWISDAALSTYGKFRFPNTKKFFSIFGSLGLDLHLAQRQLINQPDQYKSNWALGWTYGAGIETRIKSVAIDAKFNCRRVFGADYRFYNTNEILIGIGLISEIKG